MIATLKKIFGVGAQYFPESEVVSVKTLVWKRGLCGLRHGTQSSIEAILACHPALSTEWLAGWQFCVNYEVFAQAPLILSGIGVCLLVQRRRLKFVFTHIMTAYQCQSVPHQTCFCLTQFQVCVNRTGRSHWCCVCDPFSCCQVLSVSFFRVQLLLSAVSSSWSSQQPPTSSVPELPFSTPIPLFFSF